MLRALILVSAILLFRAFLPNKPRRSPTAASPYMNSLDGLMSASQLSSVLEEIESHAGKLEVQQVESRRAP
jgi:hypothetical protein